jgi:hypothetical protein
MTAFDFLHQHFHDLSMMVFTAMFIWFIKD